MSELLQSIQKGFINYKLEANVDYIPKLLVNNPEEGEKVLTTIIKELNKCDSFMFCVAFLTMGGYQVLLKTLIELEERNIPGIIIVSQYQNFTDPQALRKLKNLKNIDLRIITEDECKMHSKGYIFKKGENYKIIVGSSNLTQDALCVNKEWNVEVSSKDNGSYTKMVIDGFNYMYSLSKEVTDEFIDEYEKYYTSLKQVNKTVSETNIFGSKVVPNKMQQEALINLNLIRESGEDRALAISSTGTGKTILCALDVQAFKPKKFLFVVHREQIAKDAMKTFKRVIGKNIDACLLGGGNLGNAQYIFSMIQTISRDEYLYRFDNDEFDYIVFDEAHRIGAPTYQKVFKYFKPKFILGMTATPERGDGFNIYQLFNYNLACDIRLDEAMKEDLICPFHYYAIADLETENGLIDDKASFNLLVSEDRVKHVINKIQTYGYYGSKVKGLVFVSSVDEAKALSKEFNNYGFKTKALSGSDSQEEREKVIDLLESDDPDNSIDYIFTVDIFNEGIDIQKINQVVMLRPTQSAIIFVQQLGRGLRKHIDKEYLVVLDFVGNYDQNFLIPIALSGSRRYRKDDIRRFVKEANKTIQGASTVNFEKVVEKNIFEKIDKADFTQTKLIKDSYKALKNKLGRIPTIFDFEKYGEIDVLNIFNKYDSYHEFLMKNEKDYLIRFNQLECTILKLLCKKYASGKRPHEVLLLNKLIKEENVDLDNFKNYILEKYPKIKYDDNTQLNLINQMTGKYISGTEKVQYEKVVFSEVKDKQLYITEIFKNLLSSDKFKQQVLDILLFAYDRYYKHYLDNYKETSFKLYEKYTFEDVCRLLDWNIQEIANNIGGYKYHKLTNTFPVFINYKKEEDISDSIKYEDRFETRNKLIAISKNGRTLSSPDIQAIKSSQENNTKIYLFVRKNKDDVGSKEFYFLGEMYPTGEFEEFMMNKKDKAVKIKYILADPVREELYDYITGE